MFNNKLYNNIDKKFNKKPPENVIYSQGITSNYRRTPIALKAIFLLFIFTFVCYIGIQAQNFMHIKNVNGKINDQVLIPFSISNQEEFISFQCDIQLPDGFSYIDGSISLSARSVDHVVSVTNIENNRIRIFSYSMNNTPFLLDSGMVVDFRLNTPSNAGQYTIKINNGIIGNSESANILDSVVSGEVSLGPAGILDHKINEQKITCFPNPFDENMTIQLAENHFETVNMQVFDMNGKLLSSHLLAPKLINKNIFTFNTIDLLGINSLSTTYFLHFSFSKENRNYSIVKKIQLKK